MINLYCQRGDILNMEQETVNKDFLERFGPDRHKTLIKR